jgi:hypothetical protein
MAEIQRDPPPRIVPLRPITVVAPNGIAVKTDVEVVCAALVSLLTPEQRNKLVETIIKNSQRKIPIVKPQAETVRDTPAVLNPGG